jgi:hypothetical protein
MKNTFAFSFLVVVALTGFPVLDAPIELGTASPAMVRGGGGIDCPHALGECYQSCQEVEPTPDEACFTYCTCGFYECIGSPAPACSASSV